MHIAPEKCYHSIFKSLPKLDYLSADLQSPLAMMKMDITNIQFPENSFDAILCNHVLEHVPDDQKALQELFRVLKPAGWALIQVPIEPDREVTYEDQNVASPVEREQLFGQHDHVRKYGRDFIQRLNQAGFSVQIIPYYDHLPLKFRKKHALLSENINFCSKT